jgi:hypothetical protein
MQTFVASYRQQRRQIRDEKTGLTNSLGLCGFNASKWWARPGDTDAGVVFIPCGFANAFVVGGTVMYLETQTTKFKGLTPHQTLIQKNDWTNLRK